MIGIKSSSHGNHALNQAMFLMGPFLGVAMLHCNKKKNDFEPSEAVMRIVF